MFSTDLRSLGLLRIALGFAVLLDLTLRSLSFRAHYTRDGILTLEQRLRVADHTWSPFFLGDSPLFVGALMALGSLAALALMLGWHTRTASWLSWIVLVGLQRRNPMLLDGGDLYLALILFWGCFLPWDRVFSLDGRGRAPETNLVRSPATAAFTLQVCLLYWLAAIPRVGPEWQVDGSALYYVAHSGVSLVAQGLLHMGEPFLAFMTRATLLLEEIGPFFLLLPLPRLRLATILALVCFHLGVELTLRLGVFSLVCVAAPLGLLPSLAWEGPRARRVADFLSGLFARLGQGRGWGESSPGRLEKLYGLLPIPALLLTLLFVTLDFQGWRLPEPAQRMAEAFGLNQRWTMYSPRPSHEVGLQTAKAITASGQKVELITGQAWRDDQDAPVPPTPWLDPFWYRDYRWLKFRVQLRLQSFRIASVYLRYLVRRWDAAHPEDPVVAARYLYRGRQTLPGYHLGPEPVTVKAWYLR